MSSSECARPGIHVAVQPPSGPAFRREGLRRVARTAHDVFQISRSERARCYTQPGGGVGPSLLGAALGHPPGDLAQLQRDRRFVGGDPLSHRAPPLLASHTPGERRLHLLPVRPHQVLIRSVPHTPTGWSRIQSSRFSGGGDHGCRYGFSEEGPSGSGCDFASSSCTRVVNPDSVALSRDSPPAESVPPAAGRSVGRCPEAGFWVPPAAPAAVSLAPSGAG